MSTQYLSSKVHRLLKERGISQSSCAELIGGSPGHLSRLLAGKRKWTVHYVEAVARALDLSAEELVLGTEASHLLQTNGGTVEREYAEKLSTELAMATSKLQALDAELGTCGKANELAERDRSRLAGELERARGRLEAADAIAREASNRADHLAARLGRAEQKSSELERQNRVLTDRVKAMQESIMVANRQVAINYDAWRQAEAERCRLAQVLGASSSSNAGAALFAGLVGLGLGVGLGSGRS